MQLEPRDSNCSNTAANATSPANATAQKQTRMSHELTTQCGSTLEMGRAGIEPATPGFSVGVSSQSQPITRRDSTVGYGDNTSGPISRAQQKAQHFLQSGSCSGTPRDSRLAVLVERWDSLSVSVRDEIMRLSDAD